MTSINNKYSLQNLFSNINFPFQHNINDLLPLENDTMIYAPIPKNIYDIEINKEQYENIKKYLNSINKFNIWFINGVSLTGYSYYCDYCDYCKTFAYSVTYYCFTCHNNMCYMCYSLKYEESGIPKSKELDNKIDLCILQHTLERKTYLEKKKCCSCKKKIYINYYTNGDNNYLCFNCFNDNNFEKKYSSQKDKFFLNKFGNSTIFNFGSILDWVPILIDDGYNAILQNINIDSPYFMNCCLMARDDYGIMGYYTTNISNIDILIEKKKEIEKEIDILEKNRIKYKLYSDIYKHGDYPINNLMRSLNLKVNFG